MPLQNGVYVPVLSGGVEKTQILGYNPYGDVTTNKLGAAQPLFDWFHNALDGFPSPAGNWLISDPAGNPWQYPNRIDIPEITPTPTTTQKEINKKINGNKPTIQDLHNATYNALSGGADPTFTGSKAKKILLLLALAGGAYYLYKHWN